MRAVDKNYYDFIVELKQKITKSQQKAIQSVNYELVMLYWEIGKAIIDNQTKQGWGAKIIESLSKELQNTFPNMRGFSSRNLKYMRQFATTYVDNQFVQEVLARLSWYNNLTLMQKIKDGNLRNWYIYKNIENGWSQSVLVHQIESNLYARSENKIEAEYALRDINKPIGISEYQITKSLPNDLKSTLPTTEEIEEKLEND